MSSSVQLKPGEDLILVLPIPGPVEVIYNTSDSSGPCCELICTVVGGSLHCEDEYSLRVSLRYPNLTLEAVNVSDNGVYIVRDRKHNEDLHVYNVSVEGTSLVWAGSRIFIYLYNCRCAKTADSTVRHHMGLRELFKLRSKYIYNIF